MYKFTKFKGYIFGSFYSFRFQSVGAFDYLQDKFDYFGWWVFKFIYFLSFLGITYALLRSMTYSLNSEFFYGFFEMVALGLKFFVRSFREVLISINSTVEDNIQLVVTMRDIDKRAIESIPDYQELPKSSDTEYARIFDPSPDDFEDNYWIDPSVFDIWSYNLVNGTNTFEKSGGRPKSVQNFRKVTRSKKIHKK